MNTDKSSPDDAETQYALRLSQKYIPFRTLGSSEERYSEEISHLLKQHSDSSSSLWSPFTSRKILQPGHISKIFLFKQLDIYYRFYDSCLNWKDSKGFRLFDQIPLAQPQPPKQEEFGWGESKTRKEGEEEQEWEVESAILDIWFGSHDILNTIRTLWEQEQRNAPWEEMSNDDWFIMQTLKGLAGTEMLFS